MTIHTIGDSHSNFGWTGAGVEIHHIGALLCHSFGKQPLDRCDIRNFNIKDDDTIIFCMGEIDCRCHVYKYVGEYMTYQDVINCIVVNYMEAIKLNLNTSLLKLKNVCVYNVVPPIQKFNTFENREYPFLGTDDERKAYVTYFNYKLNQECIKNSFIFFDIYDKYSDSNGFLRKDLSDGNVHIKNGCYVTEALNNMMLK